MKKKSYIRDQNSNPCPFGLSIPSACCYAGKSIERMAPLDAVPDDKKDTVKKSNALVYMYHKTGDKCPFADSIIKDFNKVDCDFKDTGEGQKSVQYTGSPLYPHTFSGVGLDGLYSFPLGWYSDNNYSRNLFYGLFSLQGFDTVEKLIKLADTCDRSENTDLADKLDEILVEFKNTNGLELEEKIQKLAKILDELKIDYDDKRVDNGIMWELISKWYGPHQIVGR